MNIANVYRNLRQIFEDSNKALIDRGLHKVNCFTQIPFEIDKLGEINKLPFLLRKEIIQINEEDFIENNIKDYAFFTCRNLETITIGKSVTQIGSTVFSGCANLQNVYLNPVTPPNLKDTTGFPSTTTIHVPVGSGDAYKSATNWSVLASQIVEDIVIE